MAYTKQDIVDYVTCNNKYASICRRLLSGDSLHEDLYQDFVLQILESKEDRFESVQCIDCFLYKMLTNMVNSKTSKFHYTYKRRISDQQLSELKNPDEYDASLDDKAIKAKGAIENLCWHDKKILEMFLGGKDKKTIAEEKNVPRYFISKKIKQITEKVRQEIRMKELGQPIKILLITQKDTTALQYHRQYIPHERLQKTHGGEFKIEFTHGEGQEASIGGMTDSELQEYQIVYYLRQISFNKDKVKPTIDRLHSLGLKVVLDIDDYWYLPQDHHWCSVYKEKKVAENVIETIKLVDHVITTTTYFADKIKQITRSNVTILPNCISPDAKQFDKRLIESNRLRFGWIGGVFHQPDIKMIEECFSKINKLYGDKLNESIQVSVGGFSCNYEYKEIEKTFTANYSFRNTDATYYNYLMQCTPTMEHISFDKPYRRLWGRDIHSYGQLYNEIDVALIPLVDNTFNKCKSELKIVEAGWMGKAVICSNITPYKEYIKNEVNGILINPSRNNIDWYLAMKRLSENKNLVADMGAALNETIKTNFDLDKHNQVRADLYKSLI